MMYEVDPEKVADQLPGCFGCAVLLLVLTVSVVLSCAGVLYFVEHWTR